MSVQSQLTRNILNTIIYFDLLKFPLTPFEIWKHLLTVDNDHKTGFSLGDVVEALENEELKKHVEDFRGFYFLKGHRDLIAKRIQKDKNSIIKFNIAEKVARFLRYVPFVRMVAVTGTVAMKNCEKSSDIDFFVILEKGRIFTGRLLTTGLVHILGKRRYGKKIQNRICLNYFVTSGSLEITKKDVFEANEYSFIYPIFGFNIFQKFCGENLDWIKKLTPNWEIPDLVPAKYYVESGKISSFIQKSFENLINIMRGDRIESWLTRVQIARIERNPLTQKAGAYIEATNENLIFLPEPQGVRIGEQFQMRLNS